MLFPHSYPHSVLLVKVQWRLGLLDSWKGTREDIAVKLELSFQHASKKTWQQSALTAWEKSSAWLCCWQAVDGCSSFNLRCHVGKKKGSKPIFHLFYEYKIHVTTVPDNSNHGKYLHQCCHLGVIYSHFAHDTNWTNLPNTPSALSRVTLCWAFPESAAQGILGCSHVWVSHGTPSTQQMSASGPGQHFQWPQLILLGSWLRVWPQCFVPGMEVTMLSVAFLP